MSKICELAAELAPLWERHDILDRKLSIASAVEVAEREDIVARILKTERDILRMPPASAAEVLCQVTVLRSFVDAAPNDVLSEAEIEIMNSAIEQIVSFFEHDLGTNVERLGLSNYNSHRGHIKGQQGASAVNATMLRKLATKEYELSQFGSDWRGSVRGGFDEAAEQVLNAQVRTFDDVLARAIVAAHWLGWAPGYKPRGIYGREMAEAMSDKTLKAHDGLLATGKLISGIFELGAMAPGTLYNLEAANCLLQPLAISGSTPVLAVIHQLACIDRIAVRTSADLEESLSGKELDGSTRMLLAEHSLGDRATGQAFLAAAKTVWATEIKGLDDLAARAAIALHMAGWNTEAASVGVSDDPFAWPIAKDRSISRAKKELVRSVLALAGMPVPGFHEVWHPAVAA